LRLPQHRPTPASLLEYPSVLAYGNFFHARDHTLTTLIISFTRAKETPLRIYRVMTRGFSGGKNYEDD
jgi:hypothetical protein